MITQLPRVSGVDLHWDGEVEDVYTEKDMKDDKGFFNRKRKARA